MPDVNHKNQQFLVPDFVDDAVGAYANSPSRPPGKFLAANGPWIIRKTPDSVDDASPGRIINLCEAFLSRA